MERWWFWNTDRCCTKTGAYHFCRMKVRQISWDSRMSIRETGLDIVIQALARIAPQKEALAIGATIRRCRL